MPRWLFSNIGLVCRLFLRFPSSLTSCWLSCRSIFWGKILVGSIFFTHWWECIGGFLFFFCHILFGIWSREEGLVFLVTLVMWQISSWKKIALNYTFIVSSWKLHYWVEINSVSSGWFIVDGSWTSPNFEMKYYQTHIYLLHVTAYIDDLSIIV